MDKDRCPAVAPLGEARLAPGLPVPCEGVLEPPQGLVFSVLPVPVEEAASSPGVWSGTLRAVPRVLQGWRSRWGVMAAEHPGLGAACPGTGARRTGPCPSGGCGLGEPHRGGLGRDPHRYWAPRAAFSEGARLRRTRAQLGFRGDSLGTGAPQMLHGTRQCGNLQQPPSRGVRFTWWTICGAEAGRGQRPAEGRGRPWAEAFRRAWRAGRAGCGWQVRVCGLCSALCSQGPWWPEGTVGSLLCTCCAQVPSRCLAARVTDRLEPFPVGFFLFFFCCKNLTPVLLGGLLF